MNLYQKLHTCLFVICAISFNAQASKELSPAKIKKSVSFSDTPTVIKIAGSNNSLNLNSVIRHSTSSENLTTNLKRKTEDLLATFASNKAARNK